MKRILLAVVVIVGVIALVVQGIAFTHLSQDQTDIMVYMWQKTGGVASFVSALFLALFGPAFLLWNWDWK